MKTYLVTVDETLIQTSVYTIRAESEEEARKKAESGETESEETDTYSREIADRKIRKIKRD